MDGTMRGSVRGNSDVSHSSRVGSCCFVLYSFATDVLTAASSRVSVLRPGSAVLVESYAYVGPLSSLAGAVGPVLPASSVGASFVFGLVPYSVPALLPVGLLSASPSGLGCVSLSLESSAGGAGVAGVVGGAGVVSGDGAAGAGGGSPGLSSRECIFLVLRDDRGGDGDSDGNVGDLSFLRAPASPPLSYYTWSFVRSSLSRFYSSVGVAGGPPAAALSAGVAGVASVAGVVGASPPASPLRFSDLSLRFSGRSSVSDGSASEDDIVSLLHSVRRAFD